MAANVTEQLLTFLLGKDEYGISIRDVREIAEYRIPTPVPMRPAWMRGVMNLRGAVVPVVDLAAKLGLGASTASRFTCLIIVDLDVCGERNVVAMMVDSVSRVVDVVPEDVREAPPFGMIADVVPGMVRIEGKWIVLLDLGAIVAGEELTAPIPAGDDAAPIGACDAGH
jgi:purine-binding chemotaxis protein CheW